MTLNQAFALRVRAYMGNNGFTQKKIEDSAGIYHSTMDAILNGRTKSSNFKTMALIIRALGVTVQEFFNSSVFNFDYLDID